MDPAHNISDKQKQNKVQHCKQKQQQQQQLQLYKSIK